jgi:hypothetical protein
MTPKQGPYLEGLDPEANPPAGTKKFNAEQFKLTAYVEQSDTVP